MQIKKSLLIGGWVLTVIPGLAQSKKANKLLSAAEALRIENTLASDEMRGRKVFSPEIDKAAAFIADEFKSAGLETWNESGTYRQEFVIVRPKLLSVTATVDGAAVESQQLLVITSQPQLRVTPASGFEKKWIASGANLAAEARTLARSQKNLLVLVDRSHDANFGNLNRLRNSFFKSDYSVIFLLVSAEPGDYVIEATHSFTEQAMANVVGVLPGKSRKNEFVIFSGHYDHIGVGKPVNGDSIFNGANDDAAGTTAVILLAKYFKALNNNERTLVFATFTAEESGGFGSQYFSRQFDPAQVAAMFNIEMIGTESKWGTRSAYITGYEKTDMGAIMQKNLEGTGFTFYPDPYTSQNLFYRSDNATLARLGVPAHTISTSKMDNEPYYHKVSDEVSTLDMENMVQVIQSIALSARTIISGKDSPSRVKVEDLR